VLPLENLSGNPEQDYFPQGMHDALITDLGKLSGLRRVIARSSVMRYRKTDKPLRQIAQELGVEAVITGSVLREGNRVRITTQLIKAATEAQMWAERYERELRGVLSLQNEIVVAIAREVRLQLTPREQVRLAGARPINPETYEAYLKGMSYLNKYTLEAFQKGWTTSIGQSRKILRIRWRGPRWQQVTPLRGMSLRLRRRPCRERKR